MTILDAFATTLPVLLLVGLGMLLRSRAFFKPGVVEEIKKLVVNITMPLVLYGAFARMQFEPKYAAVVALMFGLCGVVLAGALFVRRIRIGQTGFFGPSTYGPFLMAGFENGMMGYAIFGAVFGSALLSKFAVVDLGQVIFVFFVLLTAMDPLTARRRNVGELVGGFLRTPAIVGILAGILANISGVQQALEGFALTRALVDTAALLAGLTMPLVGLVLGFELNIQPGRLAAPLRTALLRLALWVGLGLLVNRVVIAGWLGLDAGFQAAVMLMFVMPAPFVIPLYLKDATQDEKAYILNTLTISTLLALAGVVLVRVMYPI